VKTDEGMRDIAEAMEYMLKKIFGSRMGFGLVVFPFGENNRVADYITNGKNEHMVDAFRETADMIEQGNTIPDPIGEA
jgi:hypothetical protein